MILLQKCHVTELNCQVGFITIPLFLRTNFIPTSLGPRGLDRHFQKTPAFPRPPAATKQSRIPDIFFLRKKEEHESVRWRWSFWNIYCFYFLLPPKVWKIPILALMLFNWLETHQLYRNKNKVHGSRRTSDPMAAASTALAAVAAAALYNSSVAPLVLPQLVSRVLMSQPPAPCPVEHWWTPSSQAIGITVYPLYLYGWLVNLSILP